MSSSRKRFMQALHRGDMAGAIRAADGRAQPDPRHPQSQSPLILAALGRPATGAELDASDRRFARRNARFASDEQ